MTNFLQAFLIEHSKIIGPVHWDLSIGVSAMKLAILICATLLIGAGCLCNASGAQAADTPGQALDESQCQTGWTMVSPNGATLSKDEAEPYVLNFTTVDTNHDEAIDANEFKVGCQGGLTGLWSEPPVVNDLNCKCGSRCYQAVCLCKPC